MYLLFWQQNAKYQSGRYLYIHIYFIFRFGINIPGVRTIF